MSTRDVRLAKWVRRRRITVLLTIAEAMGGYGRNWLSLAGAYPRPRRICLISSSLRFLLLLLLQDSWLLSNDIHLLDLHLYIIYIHHAGPQVGVPQ
jgi:hypothetical protein